MTAYPKSYYVTFRTNNATIMTSLSLAMLIKAVADYRNMYYL